MTALLIGRRAQTQRVERKREDVAHDIAWDGDSGFGHCHGVLPASAGLQPGGNSARITVLEKRARLPQIGSFMVDSEV